MTRETTTEPAGAAAPAAAPPPHRRGTVGDMVRSMSVVLVFVALLVLVVQRRHGDAVKVVDYSSAVAKARSIAAYQVLAPAGLPADWRATSVRLGRPEGRDQPPLSLHVGFVTPDGQYAAVEESDQPDRTGFVRDVVGKGAADGSVDVAGQAWELHGTEAGDHRSLVRRTGTAVYVVTGSASVAELSTLAGALSAG